MPGSYPRVGTHRDPAPGNTGPAREYLRVSEISRLCQSRPRRRPPLSESQRQAHPPPFPEAHPSLPPFRGHQWPLPRSLERSRPFSLEALTPRTIETFVARTGIDPTHEEPWKKVFVGGSMITEASIPPAPGPKRPNARRRRNFSKTSGTGSVRPPAKEALPSLAHGTYNTAYQFLKAKFALKPGDPAAGLIEKGFSRFMEGKDPTEFTLAEKIGFLAQGIASESSSSSRWQAIHRSGRALQLLLQARGKSRHGPRNRWRGRARASCVSHGEPRGKPAWLSLFHPVHRADLRRKIHREHPDDQPAGSDCRAAEPVSACPAPTAS